MGEKLDAIMILKKYQKFALAICTLPIFGCIVAHLTQNYRYNEDLRYIYLIGVITVYLSWGISFIWGLINSTEIFRSKNTKKPFKIIWGTISLLPVLYFISILFMSIVYDPLKDDIVLPSGEHISGEYQ